MTSLPLALAIALVVSLIIALLLVVLPLPSIFYDSNRGVQRFHTDKKIPRIGGLAILIGFAVSFAYANISNFRAIECCEFGSYDLLTLIFFAFLIGFAEDILKKLPQSYRLILSFVVAWLACQLLNIGFYSIGSNFLDDQVFANRWVAISVAVVMIGGVMHSINIIDGYNGLATGVAILALSALGIIAAGQGDARLALICFIFAAAILGTMLINYPLGRIFIGDGGAYMIGFVIAVISLLLVKRNPEVSPWAALMIVALPVWETLFSIFRRKILTRSPATEPDILHLHNLIHSKLISRYFAGASALAKNSLVAPFMWAISLFGIIWSLIFWSNSPLLLLAAFLFAVIYSLLYNFLAKLEA